MLGSETNFNQGFDTYIETYKEDSPLGLESRNTADTVHAVRPVANSANRRRKGLSSYGSTTSTRTPATNLPRRTRRRFMVDGHYDPTKLRLNEDNDNFHGGVAGKYWRRNDGQEERGWYGRPV